MTVVVAVAFVVIIILEITKNIKNFFVRKSFWCNNFLTNKVQKKIVPYMIEYFLLQLTTIALEQQYEDNKGKYVHIKTYILVFKLLSYYIFI